MIIDNYTTENKKPAAEIDISATSDFGRLHFIKSSRLLSKCRVCSKEIQIKESCFRQSVNNQGFFPQISRVCIICAKKLVEEGTLYVGIDDIQKLYKQEN